MCYTGGMKRVLLGVDQLVNTLLGLVPRFRRAGFGDEDETISSVLGRLSRKGSRLALIACRGISWILSDPGHCVDSIEEDGA